jgi:hypothetical protein
MNNDHDHDRNRDPANDNGEQRHGGKQVAPALTGGALTSLAALQAALASVPTATIMGRSGKPMMLFKSRENNGTYGIGQKRLIPEEGSKWAVNPMTFQWGYICFNDAKKVLGEELVSVSQPKPDLTKLPNLGFPWQEEWAVEMKCLSGVDSGVEVVFKATTYGAMQAVVLLLGLVKDRLNDNVQPDGKIPPDSKIVPIVLLEKDCYPHKDHGRIWFPVLNNVDWMSLDGPAPAPKPVPQPPSEQPRRRRAG